MSNRLQVDTDQKNKLQIHRSSLMKTGMSLSKSPKNTTHDKPFFNGKDQPIDIILTKNSGESIHDSSKSMPRVTSNLNRFRKPSPQVIPVVRLPMPKEGVQGQSIAIATPVKAKAEQAPSAAPKQPGQKKSPHQMTVKTQIEVFQQMGNNLYQTQPIKVAGYGLVMENDQQKVRRINVNPRNKMFQIRHTQESNGRIQFGSKGVSSTSLGPDQRMLYDVGQGATLTSQVSQQWATLPQTQLDDSLKTRNFRFDSRKNSVNLVQPSLSNQNSKILIQHQAHPNQRFVENSETGDRSPNNNFLNPIQGGSSSNYIDQSAPFLNKTPKLIKKPTDTSKNLLTRGSNSLLEMISSKQKDLVQKEKNSSITGAQPQKPVFSASKGSHSKTPRKEEGSKKFSNRDLGNLLNFDKQNINFKHLDSGQIEVPQVATQSPKNSQPSPIKTIQAPKSKKRRGRQTGKEKEVLEILERYTKSITPKPVTKKDSKFTQNSTPVKPNIKKKRSATSVEKVVASLPVIDMNIIPTNEKISQLNESQEGSSPHYSKPIKVRKLESNKIQAQAVNINSSEGSIDIHKVGGESIHIPTGTSQIHEKESVSDINEPQEQKREQSQFFKQVQKKRSNEVSQSPQPISGVKNHAQKQPLQKISSKAHKLALELQTQFEEQQYLMKQYQLLNQSGKDSNIQNVRSIVDPNLQEQFTELILKTKNSTQVSDDILAAKDFLDRQDILVTDASNQNINPKYTKRPKRTSQPKIPILRETMSLNKVMIQTDAHHDRNNGQSLMNQTSRSFFIPSYTKSVSKGKKNIINKVAHQKNMLKVQSTAKKELNTISQTSEAQFQSSKEFIIQVNVDAQQPPITFAQRNSSYKYAGKRSPKEAQIQILNLQKVISKLAVESRDENMITQKGSPWSPSSLQSQVNINEQDTNGGVGSRDQGQKGGSPRQDGQTSGKMQTSFLIAEDAFRNKLINKTSFASSFRDMQLNQQNINQIISKRKLSPSGSPVATDLLVQGDNIKINHMTSKNSPAQSRAQSSHRQNAKESTEEEKLEDHQSTSENDDISYTSNQLSSPTGFNKHIGKSAHNSSNRTSNRTNKNKSSSRLFWIAEHSDSKTGRSSQPLRHLDFQEQPSNNKVKLKKPYIEGQLNTIVAQQESEETTEFMGTNSPIQEPKGHKIGQRSPLQNQDLQLKLTQMNQASKVVNSPEQSEVAGDDGSRRLSKNANSTSRHQIFKKHTPAPNEVQIIDEKRKIKREVSKQFIEMKLPVNELKFRTQKNFLPEKNDNQESQQTAKDPTAWSKQSINMQILNQTKTSFLGTHKNENQNTQNTKPINDGQEVAGANTTRATSKFVPAAISAKVQKDEVQSPKHAIQIQDGRDDNKKDNKTPSSIQKTPLTVTSPSRASVAKKSTTPTPIRIEIDKPGTKEHRHSYKKVSQLKDVQVKYRNARSIDKKAPTPKQFEAIKCSTTPLSRQLENSPSAMQPTTLKQHEQQIIQMQTKVFKGVSKSNILKAAVTSIKTNRAQGRQTIQIQLDQKLLQSKFKKKKQSVQQDPNLPPILNQAQQISLALSKANIEQSWSQPKQHQVSDIVTSYYDKDNEGNAGTQAPHFALSHGGEDDEHPTQQLAGGDLVSVGSRKQTLSVQRRNLFEQNKHDGEKIDAKGMAEIIDSRIQSFGETAGERSDSAGWSFKANYTMDAKTLKIKPIDTAYRQQEPANRREFGRNLKIVHVDENMYSEERDTVQDYIVPLHDEHKTLESGDQIIQQAQNQKAKTIAVRQKNVIISRKSSSKSISIELEPRNLEIGNREANQNQGGTLYAINSLSGQTSPGLRQHLRLNAMNQTTDGFSIDQSKQIRQNQPTNKFTKQSTMQEHNFQQIDINALTPQSPILPQLHSYQKADQLDDKAYDQLLKFQQSVITPNIGNIRKVRNQRRSDADEIMTNMAVGNTSIKQNSVQSSLPKSSLPTPTPNLTATFQKMKEMYPGLQPVGSTILNDQVMFENRNRSVFVPSSHQNSSLKQSQTRFPTLGQQSPMNNSNVSFQQYQQSSSNIHPQPLQQNTVKQSNTFHRKRNTQKLFITRDQLQSIIRTNLGIGHPQKKARRSPSGSNGKFLNDDKSAQKRSSTLDFTNQRQQQNYSTQTVQQLLSVNHTGQATFDQRDQMARKASDGFGNLRENVTEETEKARHNFSYDTAPEGDISFDQRKQQFGGKTQGRTPVNFLPNAVFTKETTISPMNERSDVLWGASAESPEPTVVFKPRLGDNPIQIMNIETPQNEELPLTSIQLVYQQRSQQKVKGNGPFKQQSFVMTIPDKEPVEQMSSESGQRSNVNQSELQKYQVGESKQVKKRKNNEANAPSGANSGLKTRKNVKSKGVLNKDLVF